MGLVRLGFFDTVSGGPAGASARKINQFNGSGAIASTKPRQRPATTQKVRNPRRQRRR
jgi:hypothetical protein